MSRLSQLVAGIAVAALGLVTTEARAQGFKIPNTQPIFQGGAAANLRAKIPAAAIPALPGPSQFNPSAPKKIESVGISLITPKLYLGGTGGLGEQMRQQYESQVISNASIAQAQSFGQQFGGVGQIGQFGQGGFGGGQFGGGQFGQLGGGQFGGGGGRIGGGAFGGGGKFG